MGGENGAINGQQRNGALTHVASSNVTHRQTNGKARSRSPTRGRASSDTKKKTKASRLSMDELKLMVAILGIYGCYMSSGVLQEHIYSYKSETGERFTQTLFLLWVQCIVNCIFSGFAMFGGGRSGDKTPHKLFAMAGVAYITAMLSSMEALRYVNFPTKELGKSCKMIPVMLFGVVFAGKRYSVRDYTCVALITAGIVTFNLGGKHDQGKANSSYGLALLFISLVLDGVTGSTQENIKRVCKLTVHEMMFYMNLWAGLSLTPFALLNGQAVSGYAFCMNNSVILRDLLGFALMAAMGQNFIYFTISNFNSLVCTTITTTRKFFTILCSVLVFGHPMTVEQWGGVGMVFAGIGGNMWGKHVHSKKAHEAAKKLAK